MCAWVHERLDTWAHECMGRYMHADKGPRNYGLNLRQSHSIYSSIVKGSIALTQPPPSIVSLTATRHPLLKHLVPSINQTSRRLSFQTHIPATKSTTHSCCSRRLQGKLCSPATLHP